MMMKCPCGKGGMTSSRTSQHVLRRSHHTQQQSGLQLILVTGIPAYRCVLCGQVYVDIYLLEQIEKRMQPCCGQQEICLRYTFNQLFPSKQTRKKAVLVGSNHQRP